MLLVSLPENPAMQGIIDTMATYVVKGGDEAMARVMEDSENDPNLWFVHFCFVFNHYCVVYHIT